MARLVVKYNSATGLSDVIEMVEDGVYLGGLVEGPDGVPIEPDWKIIQIPFTKAELFHWISEAVTEEWLDENGVTQDNVVHQNFWLLPTNNLPGSMRKDYRDDVLKKLELTRVQCRNWVELNPLVTDLQTQGRSLKIRYTAPAE